MEKNKVNLITLTAISRKPKEILNHFKKYGSVDKYGERTSRLLSTDDTMAIMSSLLSRLQSKKRYSELYDFERKALTKWFGAQGGIPSKSSMLKGLEKYFSRHSLDPQPKEKGVELLKQMLFTAGYEYGSLSPKSYISSIYEYDKEANSGIHAYSDKRDKITKIWTEICYHRDYRHIIGNELLPALASHRYMRNKLRVVFMDDFSSYAKLNAWVAPLAKALGEISYGTTMWRGHYEFMRRIHPMYHDKTVCMEADAEAMDTCVWRKHIRLYVEPIMAYLYGEESRKEWEHLLDSLFTYGVMFGDEIWSGDHSLFSGVAPTNLFETIILLVLALDALAQTTHNGEVLLNYAVIEANGDDTVWLITKPGLTSDSYVEYKGQSVPLRDLLVLSMESSGLVVNPIKQRVATGNFFYCKRWYSHALPYAVVSNMGQTFKIPASSYVLALNGMLNPEYGPGYTVADELLAIMQKNDDKWGHPYWLETSMEIWEAIRNEVAAIDPKDMHQALEHANENYKLDFKNMLHGHDWDLKSSPTYKLWYRDIPYFVAPPYLGY